MQRTDEVRFSNIVSVDNTLGISINMAGETDKEKISLFKDSFVYGETSDLAKDCPDGSGHATGADCFCKSKMGHMNTVSVFQEKEPHNPKSSPRPVYKVKTYSTWNSKAVVQNVTFINFKEKTACGVG
jgi:hypothetical protein